MTEEQVRARLKERRLTWKAFVAWHRGQTYAVDSKGRDRYYDHDVEKFLANPKAAVLD